MRRTSRFHHRRGRHLSFRWSCRSTSGRWSVFRLQPMLPSPVPSNRPTTWRRISTPSRWPSSTCTLVAPAAVVAKANLTSTSYQEAVETCSNSRWNRPAERFRTCSRRSRQSSYRTVQCRYRLVCSRNRCNRIHNRINRKSTGYSRLFHRTICGQTRCRWTCREQMSPVCSSNRSSNSCSSNCSSNCSSSSVNSSSSMIVSAANWTPQVVDSHRGRRFSQLPGAERTTPLICELICCLFVVLF